MALNDTLDQMDLTGIVKTFHYKYSRIHILFKCTRTFARKDHIIGHKINLNKLKKIKVIPCLFSDHNAVKLDISRKKKIWGDHKYTEVKQHATKQ